MQQVQIVSKIKNHGQFIVPEEIRRALQWTDEIPVSIKTTKDGFTVKRMPAETVKQKKKKLTEKDWEKIFEDMKKISKLGKQGVNLTEFLRHDRDTHF